MIDEVVKGPAVNGKPEALPPGVLHKELDLLFEVGGSLL
jgi:hypothetical protein